MFRQGFTCLALLDCFTHQHAYGTITHFGQPFQTVRLSCAKQMACSAFARHY